MNIFNKLFKCKICDNILKDSILLPCGESVCHKHATAARHIKCPSCKSEHHIPSNGFPFNKLVDLLIESNIHNFDMGEEYKSALHSCYRLEESLESFDKFAQSPDEYIYKFFDQIKYRIDLKREEIKLENIRKIDNLKKDLDHLASYEDKSTEILESMHKIVSNYLSLSEINYTIMLTKGRRNMILVIKEKLESRKNYINNLIDESYSDLIDYLIDNQNKCNALKFDIDLNTRDQVKNVKNLLENSFRSLRIMKIDNENFSKIRDNVDKSRSVINSKLRELKDKILLNKGFEFEFLQFNFPDIVNKKELDFKQFNNKTVLELVVDNIRDRNENGIKENDIVYSKKSFINNIPFYVGIKFEKDNKGIVNCLACLFCSNEFDFSGINVKYKIRLFHKEYRDMDIEKDFQTTFKHFSFGYRRLTTLAELWKKYTNEIDGTCKLVVEVEVLSLQDRKQKKKNEPNNIEKLTYPQNDHDYRDYD